MQSLPVPRPSPKGSRSRKPLEPVQLFRVSLDPDIADLVAGRAVLTITVGDATDSDTQCYWAACRLDPQGKVESFELTKFGQAESYELPADLSSCSCPDGIYRSERPGGCRHARALRESLMELTTCTVAEPEDGPAALPEAPEWPGRDYADAF